MFPFSFRLVPHSDPLQNRRGVQLCEILQNGEVVGVIYPTKDGLKIVSRYLIENPESAIEIDRGKFPPIPAVLINFLR